jgi:hypothetical protein
MCWNDMVLPRCAGDCVYRSTSMQANIDLMVSLVWPPNGSTFRFRRLTRGDPGIWFSAEASRFGGNTSAKFHDRQSHKLQQATSSQLFLGLLFGPSDLIYAIEYLNGTYWLQIARWCTTWLKLGWEDDFSCLDGVPWTSDSEPVRTMNQNQIGQKQQRNFGQTWKLTSKHRHATMSEDKHRWLVGISVSVIIPASDEWK